MKEIGVKNKIDRQTFLKVSRMKPVIKPTKPHKHEGYHELIFLSGGSGIHQIDSQSIDIEPPMGFYLRPGQVHCWNFSQIPEGFVILFKEEALQTFSSTKNNLFKFPTAFNLTEKDIIFHLLEGFHQQYQADEDLEILYAFLNLILLKTSNCLQQQPSALPSEVFDFYRFKSLVEEKFLEIKQVSHYAELLKMTSYRLNVICKSVANKHATEVIKERMLLEGKKSDNPHKPNLIGSGTSFKFYRHFQL